jgi:hypothetical protein
MTVKRVDLDDPNVLRLFKPTKPPCLYPLPDGRRCCECDSCQKTDRSQEGPAEAQS